LKVNRFADDNAAGYCEGFLLAGLPVLYAGTGRNPLERNDMTTNQSPEDIEQLLAEADELVLRISSDVLNEMEEEHRLQFEIHAQKLESIKSKVQGGSVKKKAWKADSGAEGIHDAILDIIKAMRGFTKSLSG
jgi:cytochrome P450